MHMFQHKREPGFRVNAGDILLIGVCLGISAWLSNIGMGPVSWVPAYVVATFFLFCNVFRIGRAQELVWAACFTAVSMAALYLEMPYWETVLPVSIPVTAAVVFWAWRTGSYNGVRLRA